MIDDGTIPDRRGSLSIDDEGNPTTRSVLIEDGILRGYLQDRMNARLMGVAPTGNGRRESYAAIPMPRMTTPSCWAATRTAEIASPARPLRRIWQRREVEVTSGKFGLHSGAYWIERGSSIP